MFTSFFLSTILAATAVVVRADPVPSEPGPGDIFNEGGNCPISWDVDPTGVWTTMNIELMSGSNTNMNHITTVATVDGTDPTKTTFSYPCPAVTPNSAIYFYQFSSPNSPNFTWTTRFTIADANGNSVPPANPTEPDGKPIPWGIGALEDPSQAKPPPTVGTNLPSSGSSSSVSSTTSSLPVSVPVTSKTSSSVVSTPPPTIPAGTILPSTTNSNIRSSSAADPAASGASGGAASGAISLQSSSIAQMVVAVAAVAAGFAYVL